MGSYYSTYSPFFTPSLTCSSPFVPSLPQKLSSHTNIPFCYNTILLSTIKISRVVSTSPPFLSSIHCTWATPLSTPILWNNILKGHSRASLADGHLTQCPTFRRAQTWGLMLCSGHLQIINNFILDLCFVSTIPRDNGACTGKPGSLVNACSRPPVSPTLSSVYSLQNPMTCLLPLRQHAASPA